MKTEKMETTLFSFLNSLSVFHSLKRDVRKWFRFIYNLYSNWLVILSYLFNTVKNTYVLIKEDYPYNRCDQPLNNIHEQILKIHFCVQILTCNISSIILHFICAPQAMKSWDLKKIWLGIYLLQKEKCLVLYSS